jgi:hypothetical protein
LRCAGRMAESSFEPVERNMGAEWAKVNASPPHKSYKFLMFSVL